MEYSQRWHGWFLTVSVDQYCVSVFSTMFRARASQLWFLWTSTVFLCSVPCLELGRLSFGFCGPVLCFCVQYHIYGRAPQLWFLWTIAPKPLEGGDRAGGQLPGDKECPFSGVTKSGRVLKKVPESDAPECDQTFRRALTASVLGDSAKLVC